MIKLILHKANNKHYWTEWFNSQEACDAWLTEEKTRPYWDREITAQIETTDTQAQENNRTWAELRAIEYAKRIDPIRPEAIMENFLGKPEKLQALLAEYNKIKQEFPKPAGISDSKESGEAEWL